MERWDGIARALVGGLAVTSAGFFLIAVVQTPGLDPPPQSAALFLVATTAAAISYGLLAAGVHAIGYVASALSGAWVLASMALVVAGVYGSAGPETNPLGPIAWALLSLAVMAAAGLAWRDRG